MSYSKFQEGVATLDGLKVDRSEIVSGATNFAWYGPFKGNQKSSEEEEGQLVMHLHFLTLKKS